MSTVTGGAQLSAGEPTDEATRRRLRIVNVSVGVVLEAEGVLMLVLSCSQSLPVTASFLRNDPVAVQGPGSPGSCGRSPSPSSSVRRFRGEHGAAIPAGRAVAALPVRGTRLPHPVPGSQVAAGLADLRQPAAHLSRREPRRS